jgi:hypothetical protein
MKAQDVIARALRIVGVSAPGESLPGADAKDALDALNGLLAEWSATGYGFPDASVASAFTTMVADMGDRDAMAYQLAFRIGPEYGFEPSPAQIVAAGEAWSRMTHRYFTVGTQDFSELPGQRGGYNIDAE